MGVKDREPHDGVVGGLFVCQFAIICTYIIWKIIYYLTNNAK